MNRSKNLIYDGNSVYEIDIESITKCRENKMSKECDVNTDAKSSVKNKTVMSLKNKEKKRT